VRRWWLRLLRYALPQWKGVSASLLLAVLGVAIDVLKPWPLKLIVDSVLGGQPLPPFAGWLSGMPGGETAETLLAWLAAGTLFLFLAAWARELAQSYLYAVVGSRMVYNLGAELFDHLQHLSLRFH
jgi:ATP-binding cassette subfamily B protein